MITTLYILGIALLTAIIYLITTKLILYVKAIYLYSYCILDLYKKLDKLLYQEELNQMLFDDIIKKIYQNKEDKNDN